MFPDPFAVVALGDLVQYVVEEAGQRLCDGVSVPQQHERKVVA